MVDPDVCDLRVADAGLALSLRKGRVRSQSGCVQSPDATSSRPTFRGIFETQLTFLWNTLARFGVADRDLEDVAHEVFVVVSRRLSDYDPSRPLRPWLFAIAYRCASDYRNRAAHRMSG